ncbi:MAG: TetR/AcrR family transcriptional regulator [Sterolibacterium sp.]|nr:TetR/AcrR family transcriptional regulator [Sterolibacterium sp.]
MSPANASPPVSEMRARLVEAAAEAFFEVGYSVSMGAIAARAGVAKQTLYNHFSGKDTLFSEVVRRDAQRMSTALEADGGSLRTRLLRFAIAFRTLVLSQRCTALHRTLIGESLRFPEMARAFYESGPAHTIQELTRLLAEEMRAGRLRGDGAADAEFAADMLLSMLGGTERTRCLLGMEGAMADENPARAEKIVDGFLRMFKR